MGRETSVQVVRQEGDKYIMVEDIGYVCGRSDVTNYIWTLCHEKGSENEDEGFIVFAPHSELADDILDELNSYGEKDQRQYNRAEQAWEDLRCARRNAATPEAFREFSDSLESIEDWMHEWYSEAQDLEDMVRKAVRRASYEENRYIKIICSD